jgi:hypothetical protein
MSGVAGPMLRNRRSAGGRFLAGLLVGELAASILLAVPAFLVGKTLSAVIGLQARLWVVAAICLFFGLADLANRTPRFSRQVPEDLIGKLPPGPLGLAWGFDLGLLFTTQKAVSLIWVAIAATVLLDPPLASAVIIGIGVIASMAVAAFSLWWPGGGRPSTWASRVRQARYGSGAVILALFTLTAVQAWHA